MSMSGVKFKSGVSTVRAGPRAAAAVASPIFVVIVCPLNVIELELLLLDDVFIDPPKTMGCSMVFSAGPVPTIGVQSEIAVITLISPRGSVKHNK